MNDLLHGQQAPKTGPVECLGQTFPSDEARREHFLKLLAEKLKDPAFRKIEGFPQGTDEAILAMSDRRITRLARIRGWRNSWRITASPTTRRIPTARNHLRLM